MSISYVREGLERVTSPDNYLHMIIPVLVMRLGQPEITETSEELRLVLMELLSFLVNTTQKYMAP